MKILVAIKRAVDYNVRVQVKPDGSGVATQGVKMSINPFDEIALEQALRIKEAGDAEEVVVVSIGPEATGQQLRTALAMGADRAILVKTDQVLQPHNVARVFKAVIDAEEPQIMLLGKQAIDDDCNQTGQMLSALWDRPQATFVSDLQLTDGKARVKREVDAGLESIEVDLPAVITADLRLNEPRYVKLPDIMKAKRKPLDEKSLEEMGVEMAPQWEETRFEKPPERQRGVMVDDTDQLVSTLKDKGLIT